MRKRYLVLNLFSCFPSEQCLRLKHRIINLFESIQSRNLILAVKDKIVKKNNNRGEAVICTKRKLVIRIQNHGHLFEMVEEPVPQAHVFGREVARPLGRIHVDFLNIGPDGGAGS